ncbi:MAG: CapA family protein, partial [Clostridia bacterium]|nr:CapA family protein [Clostridia bacterium]
IVYNLGNFLFSRNNVDTALLKVTLTSEGKVTLQLIPAVQKDCKVTSEAGTEKGKEILRTVESISEGIVIASDGTVTR